MQIHVQYEQFLRKCSHIRDMQYVLFTTKLHAHFSFLAFSKNGFYL